jgi:hypothetical protein
MALPNPPFFIAAAPRSRTRWLTALLSLNERDTGTRQQAVCYHEATLLRFSRSGFYSYFENAPSHWSMGAAGSDLIFTDFLTRVPEQRLLVVHRPPEEVWKSVLALDITKEKDLCKELFFEAYPEILHGLETKNPKHTLHLSYEALSDPATIQRVHEHLLPDIEFTPYLKKRAVAMQKTHIALDREDILKRTPGYRRVLEDVWASCPSPANQWRPFHAL